MVTGCTTLRQYPKTLSIYYYLDPSDTTKMMIRDMLMFVPNLIELRLNLEPQIVCYLLGWHHYAFKLLRLRALPTRDPSFIEFLKTQPQIEEVELLSDPLGATHSRASHWPELSAPESPILPNLRSIVSDKINACFLVPNRPITRVSILASHHDLRFRKDLELHEALGKSSAPLEILSEKIQLQECPWEVTITSWCLPSLHFCQNSLKDYSLQVFGYDEVLNTESAHTLLETPQSASHGLAKIRECLSVFSKLQKFRLDVEFCEDHDLSTAFIKAVPELFRFDVWKGSCPQLVEVTLFGISLGG